MYGIALRVRVRKEFYEYVLHLPNCARAARKGALDTCIRPLYGVYISRIKKIAPETDSADTNKLATVVALTGAGQSQQE